MPQVTDIREFKTIFEVSASSNGLFFWQITTLAFCGFYFACLVISIGQPKGRAMLREFGREQVLFVSLFFLGVLAWQGYELRQTLLEAQYYRHILRDGNTIMKEGVVGFSSKPVKIAWVKVGDSHFQFHGGMKNRLPFNAQKSDVHGLLHEGDEVRVWHHHGDILRIDRRQRPNSES